MIRPGETPTERDQRLVAEWRRMRKLEREGVAGVLKNGLVDPRSDLYYAGLDHAGREALARLAYRDARRALE
jgi:hypothetical protein